MQRIDGKQLAQTIREEVKKEVQTLKKVPVLNVLLVGEDPASKLYVHLKQKAGEEAGVTVNIHHLLADTPDEQLFDLVESWNQDPNVDGILIQVPLPDEHNQDELTKSISPEKDADGFHPSHFEALNQGKITILPPVHEGILRLINETPLKLAGAQGIILSKSETFAAPLQRLLGTAGMSIEVMPPDEIDEEQLKEADLVVSAVGKLNFLKPDMVRDDAVIIDIGTNKTREGKTQGDANLKTFENTDVWITPVPGGAGPMTIALLLKNVLKIAKSRA